MKINKKRYSILLFSGVFLISLSVFILNRYQNVDEVTLTDISAFTTYTGSLDNIVKHKVLRVLTTESSFNYFIYRGEQSGYEFDMANAFVKHLNKKLKITNEAKKIKLKMIPVDHNMLIPFLKEGVGDIVASGLTATDQRKKLVNFSKPYNTVSEIIVSNDKEKLRSLKELSGKKVHVRKSSSYYDSLKLLNKSFKKENLSPLKIITLDEQLDTESIIEMVSMGTYNYTVADSHLALVGQKVFGGLSLNHDIPLGEKKSIAWAVSKKAPDLKKEINQFIPKYSKGSLLGNINIDRYFKNVPKIKSRFFSESKNQISPYDNLFKKYGEQYGWDWRMLAALAYQESRFRQNIKNRWGAIGVMQIKRHVASEPYVGIPKIEGVGNLENNIHAGVKYLTWIKDTYFENTDIPEENKNLLSLAAYNAGPGRLKKARKKAKSLGYDPDVWFGQVEYVMIKMNKIEPVKYVKDINARTKAYSIVGIEEDAEN